MTRVVLDLTERTTYRISSVPDENRLIVELSRKDNRRSPLQAMQEQNPRGLVEVLDVRFETRGEQTEVILELSEPRDPVAERLSNPPRLYFDFPESYVGRDLLRNIDVNDARVRRIRVRQNRADTVRLVLDLASAVQYRTEWREDSKRWVVHIFR